MCATIHRHSDSVSYSGMTGYYPPWDFLRNTLCKGNYHALTSFECIDLYIFDNCIGTLQFSAVKTRLPPGKSWHEEN